MEVPPLALCRNAAPMHPDSVSFRHASTGPFPIFDFFFLGGTSYIDPFTVDLSDACATE